MCGDQSLACVGHLAKRFYGEGVGGTSGAQNWINHSLWFINIMIIGPQPLYLF